MGCRGRDSESGPCRRGLSAVGLFHPVRALQSDILVFSDVYAYASEERLELGGQGQGQGRRRLPRLQS